MTFFQGAVFREGFYLWFLFIIYKYGLSMDVLDEEDALFRSPLQLPESLDLGKLAPGGMAILSSESDEATCCCCWARKMDSTVCRWM